MDEKKLFLAIGLSLIVIISWSYLIVRLYPIEKQNVTTLKSSDTFLPHLSNNHMEVASEEIIEWNNSLVFFEPQRAYIKKIIFKNYSNAEFILEKGLFLEITEDIIWEKDRQKEWPYFIYEDDKKRIIKEFIFSNINNTIELKITIQNLLTEPQKLNFRLISNELTSSQLNSPERNFYEVIFNQKEKEIRLNPRKNFSLEKLEFFAFRNRYFCLIIEPQLKDFQGFIYKINHSKFQIGLNTQINLKELEKKEFNFLIYLGFQDLDKIFHIKKEWASLVHYGAFSSITQILLWILNLFYNFLHNWGLAIITLSIFIYLLFYPLTFKYLMSLKKIQNLQPKIEELKKMYQNNPQRLNKEILELYKKEKINPLGGCLPLILQIPIFISLYQGFMRSIKLKGTSFLWIKDLSEPDRFTILGKQVNILPILWIIFMFLQQRSSQSFNYRQNEQQKIFSFIFPLILGIIFYSLPSGLMLYWLTNSILMYIFQWKIK